ncbi:MAG: imidazoleglycerol-phosphate dehydratase HisB [Bacteroides sp.]|nr:imidazoleglycerol-phosphate dehydratase HisB [Eubacterium sp.]MCM1418358.1 imidazoleglycerol-phosphate dehydratase HisB [Roseburia sp.]MCM1462840.1 imidazoleglycerol-phosphate dehydratase HisB [Bacteroides sp.]
MRTAEIKRKTKETDVSVKLMLDGSGKADIATGIGFFDHMLTALAVHGGFDLTVRCTGDLAVDGHHSVEDVGICLGKALSDALGDKTGIVRYGAAAIPMDEALGFCAVDVSGRPFLVFRAEFTNERIGEYESCLTEEFFRAFAFNAGITLHVIAEYGKNDHHITEALFKALAHALRRAVAKNEDGAALSTKGVL